MPTPGAPLSGWKPWLLSPGLRLAAPPPAQVPWRRRPAWSWQPPRGPLAGSPLSLRLPGAAHTAAGPVQIQAVQVAGPAPLVDAPGSSSQGPPGAPLPGWQPAGGPSLGWPPVHGPPEPPLPGPPGESGAGPALRGRSRWPAGRQRQRCGAPTPSSSADGRQAPRTTCSQPGNNCRNN